MTRMAQLEQTRVTVGVDTHRDVHVAVALDQLGRRLGEIELATTPAGYQRLLAWAERFGAVQAFGIEGTGCYGAGLARHLRARKVFVIEVMRPNRQTRRRKGKSDPTDAEAAARAVLSGRGDRLCQGGRRPSRDDPGAAGCSIERDQGSHSGDQRPCARCLSPRRPNCATSYELSRPAGWFQGGPAPSQESSSTLSPPQTRAAPPRPPLPATRGRNQRPRRSARPPHRHRLPHLTEAFGIVPHGRGATGRRRRQPRPAPLRGSLLNALRLLTDPRLFRPDAPAPTQPRRQPASQRSALPDRPCPHALPPADQGLRPTAHQGRQEQTWN